MAEIRSEDLQIGAYELRQSMDYVVVVHHVPSGLTVASASEKSQLQNKAKALRELHALLDAAPGPAPDRAAAEAAERELRAFAGTDPFRPLEVAAKVVLAELDRQREWIIELQRSEDELLHHKLWALREVSRLLAELDRQRARIAELERRVEDGDDAMVKLGRMSVELSGCIAQNQRLYAERDDLMVENRRIRGEASRMGNELDRQRALIAAVLARCDEKEARSPHVVGGRLPAIIPVAEVRALLEGEGR